MRPTTAHDSNVFDLHALLHPGTKFDHPRDVLAHPTLSVAEKRGRRETGHPGVMGVRRCGHRIVSIVASARRAEGAGFNRRNPGSPARAR